MNRQVLEYNRPHQYLTALSVEIKWENPADTEVGIVFDTEVGIVFDTEVGIVFDTEVGIVFDTEADIVSDTEMYLSIFLRLSPVDMLHQQECDEHEYEAEDEERRIAEEVDRAAGKRWGYDGSQLREEVVGPRIDADRGIVSHLPEHRE